MEAVTDMGSLTEHQVVQPYVFRIGTCHLPSVWNHVPVGHTNQIIISPEPDVDHLAPRPLRKVAGRGCP